MVNEIMLKSVNLHIQQYPKIKKVSTTNKHDKSINY